MAQVDKKCIRCGMDIRNGLCVGCEEVQDQCSCTTVEDLED